jgi:hypothetical protein
MRSGQDSATKMLPDPVRYSSHGFRVGNTVYLAGALADPSALIEIEGIAVLD